MSTNTEIAKRAAGQRGTPRQDAHDSAARVSNACHTCGNEYDKNFQIVMAGQRYWFDCFECAVHALAPSCASCGCRVLGHGVEAPGAFYCGAHCARTAGAEGAEDNLVIEDRATLQSAR